MYDGCPGCPYKHYKQFYDYYGDYDYADKWVSAALAGTKDMAFTSGKHGPNDFSSLGDAARIEAVKKGSAYLNVWMYVIREFEDAIDDCTSCTSDCNEHSTNSGSVHAWDEGVAFYTGSLEGTAYGGNGAGKLVYRLAEKRCANFGTCGASGAGVTGTSKVNTELFKLFANGRDWLQQGRCSSVRPVVDAVVSLMTVPLVQGSLRYAYKVGNIVKDQTAKNAAEGATFAAAVLPLVHHCNTASAAVVSANLKFGAATFSAGSDADTSDFTSGMLPDFPKVKAAFEDVYACLGITCDMVGGLLDGDSPYAGAGACTFQSAPIAGYVPGSIVTEHNKIDLDQKAMETALKAKNYTGATDAYANGGNSVSKGKFRAPACGPVCRLGPCRSAWPRPTGMRGLGPGPPPTTRPPQGRFRVPGRPACAYGHSCRSPGVPRSPTPARPSPCRHAAGLLDERAEEDVRRLPRLPVQALQAVLRLLRRLRLRRQVGLGGARRHEGHGLHERQARPERLLVAR